MRAHEIVESWNTGVNMNLKESILVPEVDAAFKEWVKNAKGDWMLIGGLVVGYYTKPRTTSDIDVIYDSSNSIPESVSGFKRTRSLAFQHNNTHVEVEVLCPENINLDRHLYDQIYDTSIVVDGIRIPSAAGLICLKLSRCKVRDVGDIESILEKHPETSIAGYNVSEDAIKKAESMLGFKINR